jgi:2-phospho-L-lactate guanylyltransferase
MLLDILEAVSASHVDETLLIGSDREVERLSSDRGMMFLSDTGEKLNQVLEHATKWTLSEGAQSVLVLPADVPLVTSKDINGIVSLCSDSPSVGVSPSHAGGTNSLMRNPPNVMPTYFGPESYKRHLDEASKLGIQASTSESQGLSLDIDLPRDLSLLFKLGEGTESQRFLRSREIDGRITKGSLQDS